MQQQYAVKFSEGDENLVEGWGMPYGGLHAGQDLAGEHFTDQTDFCFEWFDERPLLFHHGLDGEAGMAVIGRVKSWTKRDLGVWVQAQLDAHSEYVESVKELIRQGVLSFSSGAMAHLVRKDRKSGEIKVWPWVELSTTPTPCNLLATLGFAEAAKHFEDAGLEMPAEEALKAKLTAAQENALDDSDFAYIDAEGGRHLPINDASHVRNALARFDQTDFESEETKEKARRKIETRAKQLGIEVESKSAPAEGDELPDQGDGVKLNTGDMPEMADDKKPSPMAILKEMAREMGVEMSDDEMGEALDKMGDMTEMDEAAIKEKIRAMLEERQAGQKVLPPQPHRTDRTDKPDGETKAVSFEEIRRECEGMLNKMLGAASPFGPVDQGYCYVEKTYPDHVVVEVCQGGEERLFFVPYSLGPDGHVGQMGQPQEVEEVYQPVGGEPQGMALGLHSDLTKHYLESLVECTKDLQERRTKEGRVLSSGNRKRLGQCLEAMRNAAGELEGLLAASDPPKAKASDVRLRLKVLELYSKTFDN